LIGYKFTKTKNDDKIVKIIDSEGFIKKIV
jgi:hypothetical protein